MFDRKKYKDFAKIQLKNRWAIPIVITFITIIIANILSLPDTIRMYSSYSPQEIQEMLGMSMQKMMDVMINKAQADSGRSFINIILSILSSLIQFVLIMGSLNVFLKMSRSPEPVSFSDFLDGLANWRKGISTGLWETLWLFLWALISIPVIIIFTLLIYPLLDYLSFSAYTFVLLFVLLIGLIPMFIRALAYSQMFYLVAEYPELTARKAMTISILITKGYKWEIAKTLLSFAGWFILSMLTFGFVDLFVTPYYRMTMTNVFHALMKNALENEIIKPEDLSE
jgi:uncharacterized membrane protein